MNAEWLVRNIGAHWVQAGALLASALMAIRLLNFDDPRARLAAFHATLIAIVVLPLAQPWRAAESLPELASSAIVIGDASTVSQAVAQDAIGSASLPDPTLAIVAILIAGAGIRLLWLLTGLIRLGRFSRAASPVPAPAVAGEIEAGLAVFPRYIQQTGGRGPWTFGWIRPAVALPARFDELAPAFQRAVICHELVHIKRRDIVVAFVEELAVAALWFHPWMWLVRARIRVAREQAVDAQVVKMLGNRDDYVRCLVDISGHDLGPHFSQAGAGMLRPRELRARVDAIFQEVHMSRTRFAVAALAFVAVTICTGLIAVAAMPLRSSSLVPAGSSNEPPTLVSRFLIAEGPATVIRWTRDARSQAASSQTVSDTPRKQINKVYPEYPPDALERGIKGVVIVDMTVNATGDVTTAAVATGPQDLRASALKAAFALKYTPGRSITAMKIAFEYMLTGTTWGVKIGEALPNIGLRPTPQNVPADVRRAMDALEAGPPSNPDATGAYRLGSGLTPPKKIKDAPPEYPAIAQQARVQGVVIMEARIDENGNVSDVRPLRSIPLLDQAAMDAVKQWQYTPTLLNGIAVPVIMTVTVNFSLRGAEVQLRITMPDGTLTLLRVGANGHIASTENPAMSRFGFAAYLDKDPSVETVNVRIYEFDEAGNAPRQIGDVELTPGPNPVQSPTTPSFAISVASVNR